MGRTTNNEIKMEIQWQLTQLLQVGKMSFRYSRKVSRIFQSER